MIIYYFSPLWGKEKPCQWKKQLSIYLSIIPPKSFSFVFFFSTVPNAAVFEASSSKDGSAFVLFPRVRKGVVDVNRDDVMTGDHRQSQHPRLLYRRGIEGRIRIIGTVRGERGILNEVSGMTRNLISAAVKYLVLPYENNACDDSPTSAVVVFSAELRLDHNSNIPDTNRV